MNKVIRIPLISNASYKSGGIIKYSELCEMLHHLQNQTRTVKNKIIQSEWEWNNYSSDYKEKYGEYPKEKEVLGFSFTGYVYDRYKSESDMNTGNLSTVVEDVHKCFKNSLKDYLKGTRSIQEYKANQPLDLHNRSIRLSRDRLGFIISLSLFNKQYAKDNNIDTSIPFKIQRLTNSQKAVLERCYDGIYKISASKLIYDTKKKQWCLNLCYGFEPTKSVADKDTILGVDLGIAQAIAQQWSDYLTGNTDIQLTLF